MVGEIANKRIELLELAIVILIMLDIIIYFFEKQNKYGGINGSTI